MRTNYFNFLSSLAIEDFSFAKEFFHLMATHLPEALPDRYDETEPAKNRFDLDNLDTMKELWADEIFWERRAPRSSGGVTHANPVRHAMIDVSLDFAVSASTDLEPFFVEASQFLAVDYSCIQPVDKNPPKSDSMLAGVTTFHIRDCLPGIPWACCYGKPYIEMFGAAKILSQPIYECREISSGLVYCQLTKSLSDMFDDAESVETLRAEAKRHLGAECFFESPELSKRRAPIFDLGQHT